MALLFGAIIFVFSLIVGTEVSSLEERISEDRKTLTQIYGQSDEFLKATAATEAMREMAARNKDLNLKLAVKLAKRIAFSPETERVRSRGRRSSRT